MKKSIVSLAVGSAFVASAALAPVANAADNPFAGAKLESGYQLAQADTKTKDAKCGGDKGKEAKCGGDKAKDAKCGADKKKEGKCGEGKCGADKKKEGKCGEGKCGADKKK
jgi:uncharacterized low-complexity protein